MNLRVGEAMAETQEIPDRCDNDWGYHCPKCGSGQTLDILVTAWVRLTAYETNAGSHKWDDTSAAICADCGWHGKVADLAWCAEARGALQRESA